jgi:hypothetical protein
LDVFVSIKTSDKRIAKDGQKEGNGNFHMGFYALSDFRAVLVYIRDIFITGKD